MPKPLQLIVPFPSPEDTEVGYAQMRLHLIDRFEHSFIVALAEKHGGNSSAAAREAKMDRANFLRLCRRQNIKMATYRPDDFDLLVRQQAFKKKMSRE